MKHTLLTCLTFLLASASLSALPEKHYQDIFAAQIGGQTNPHFPALRSGPTAGSGAYPKSKFLAASNIQ